MNTLTIKKHGMSVLAAAGLTLVACTALIYALPSFQFLIDLELGLNWLNFWYSNMVSETYANAPTSYENFQRTYLHEMKPFMTMHVGGMATALALGWVQFIPSLRRKIPTLHRTLGMLFVLGVFIGAMGAFGMVFGGSTYGAANPDMQITIEQGMMMLAAMTMLSTMIAMRWLMAGDMRRHGDWMVIAYALVCTAIPQRFGFVIYGWLGYDFETSFQLTSQYIVQPMLIIAVWIIASRRLQHRGHTEALPSTATLFAKLPAFFSSTNLPRLLATAGIVFFAVAIFDVLPYRDFFYHNGVPLNIATIAVALLVAAYSLQQAQKNGHAEIRAQWQLRGWIMVALPVITVVIYASLTLTGKEAAVLWNTAPIFAVGAVLYLPELIISALARHARLVKQGVIDERGPLKVLLRPQPGKAHALSDFLAITLGFVQVLLFLIVAIPSFILWGLLWVLDKVPGFKRLRLASYRPVGAFAEALGKRLLADQRDMPVMHVIVQVSVTILPIFVLQLLLGEFSLTLWVLYMAFMIGPRLMQYQRIFSCVHTEGHRMNGFFTPQVQKYCTRYFENFLGQWFGEVQGNVSQGHVRVHHMEDAGYDDVQCIAHYDRTSIVDFIKFVGRENFLNNFSISLLDYFKSKGKDKQFCEARNGALIHLAFFIAVALIDWKIALAYIFVPKILFNVVTGGATFAQHAFYKQDDIHDVMACTTTFIFDNDFLNEGLHMSHHQRCAVHWSQMPDFFQANLPLYKEHDSVIFVGLDTLEVFMLLLLKRLDVLARYVMDLHGGRSQKEIEEWLRERTSPVPGVQYMRLEKRKGLTPAVALVS